MNTTPLSFARALFRRFPRHVVLVLLLLLAAGLTEGFGLLLLIPLMALVGLPLESGTPGTFLEVVQAAFEGLGVPLNLAAVLLIFLAVVGARSVLRWWSNVTSARLEQRFALDLQQRLYTAIFGASWIHLVRERIPELTHALTLDVDRVSNATSYLTRLTTLAAVNAVFVLFALAIAPGMTVLALLLGGVLMAIGGRWNRRFKEAGEELTRAGQDVSAAVQDHLGALKTAKSYAAERRTVDSFKRRSERLVDVFLGADRMYATAGEWLAIAAAVLLCVLVFGAVEILQLPAATLLLLVLIFARVVPRAVSVQSSYHILLGALPGYDNILRLTDRCEAAREAHTMIAPDILPRLSAAVVLDGVSFGYGTPPVLSDIHLMIPANKTTALIGPSGSGKTTLADLVLGLLKPSSGRILVDGVALDPARMPPWRAQIGYVTQDGALLPDTVRANLAWANPEATEEEMWEALEWAAAGEFVRGLPDGLDSLVGERGALLSGGERQRLTLAGALVRHPSLLVLDEATSALDAENEARILDALKELKGRMTVLVISHRESAVRDADTVYAVKEGNVVEAPPGRTPATFC